MYRLQPENKMYRLQPNNERMYSLRTTATFNSGSGGTKDYEELDNKPKINNTELIGNKTSSELGLQPAGNYLTEVPSEYKTKAENDELYQAKGNYLTSESDPVFASSVAHGITSTDINNWNNKSNFSGDYNDLTNKPTIPTVPSKVSAFENDVGYLTQHQDLTNYIQKSETSGLVKNDGTIDTNTYITQHQDISGKEDSSNKVTSLSPSSTDTQYPSAKCVYDMIGDVETILTTITTGGGVS